MQVVSSLSFFLFSFHVHEKTILLASLPVSLLIVYDQFHALWFNIVGIFSMYPLLVREELYIPAWAVSTLFVLVLLSVYDFKEGSQRFILVSFRNDVNWPKHASLPPHPTHQMISSIVLLMGLCLLSHIVSPPPSLPDIFAVFISCYSCSLFVLSLLLFSSIQIYMHLG